MKVIEINTDEFLMYDLHYSLGNGWNLGDGHTWIFELQDIDEVKEKIIENFKERLDKFLKDNI